MLKFLGAKMASYTFHCFCLLKFLKFFTRLAPDTAPRFIVLHRRVFNQPQVRLLPCRKVTARAPVSLAAPRWSGLAHTAWRAGGGPRRFGPLSWSFAPFLWQRSPISLLSQELYI